MWGGTGAARGALEPGSHSGISSEPVNKGWIFPAVCSGRESRVAPSIPASRKRVPGVDFVVSFVNNGISPAAQSLLSAWAVIPWVCGDVATSQIPGTAQFVVPGFSEENQAGAGPGGSWRCLSEGRKRQEGAEGLRSAGSP